MAARWFSIVFWWVMRFTGDRYWSADTNTEGRLRDRSYTNTNMPFDTTWPVLGYFDRIDVNNAVDILWYGEGPAKDLMFWGNDVDGPPPATATMFGTSPGGQADRDAFRRLVGHRPVR